MNASVYFGLFFVLSITAIGAHNTNFFDEIFDDYKSDDLSNINYLEDFWVGIDPRGWEESLFDLSGSMHQDFSGDYPQTYTPFEKIPVSSNFETDLGMEVEPSSFETDGESFKDDSKTAKKLFHESSVRGQKRSFDAAAENWSNPIDEDVSCAPSEKKKRTSNTNLSSQKKDIREKESAISPKKNVVEKFTLSTEFLEAEDDKKRTSDGEFPCLECGKEFKGMTNYKLHLLTHTQLRPYSCELCKKTFNHPTNLRAHKAIHKEKRDFICKQCGAGFTTKGNLQRHAKKACKK